MNQPPMDPSQMDPQMLAMLLRQMGQGGQPGMPPQGMPGMPQGGPGMPPGMPMPGGQRPF
jgi:hypothetical protein